MGDYYGTNGNDVIDTSKLGLSNLTNIYALAGDDIIYMTLLYAGVDGGQGNDTITFLDGLNSGVVYYDSPAGIKANLQTGIVNDGWGSTDYLINAHAIAGSNYSDNITGSNSDDIFQGTRSNDTYYGNGGNDQIVYYGVKASEYNISYDSNLDQFKVLKSNLDKSTDILNNISSIKFTGDNVIISKYNFLNLTLSGFQENPQHFNIQLSTTTIGIDSLIAGDFNGDGKVDIAVTRTAFLNFTNVPLQILSGNGYGVFKDTTSDIFQGTIPNVHFVARALTADLNNDGFADLFCIDNGEDVAPYQGTTNELYLSDSKGHLIDSSYLLPNIIANNHGASIGDVNNDGKPDILVNSINTAGTDQNNLLEFQTTSGNFVFNANNLPLVYFGDVRYNPPFQRPASDTWSAITDINADGYNDIILGGNGANTGNILGSIIYVNDGKGNFGKASPITLPSTSFANSVMAIKPIDLNGDNLPDLILSVTNYHIAYIQILINKGNGVFVDETQSRLAQSSVPLPDNTKNEWYKYLSVVDFNHDGFLDIAAIKDGGQTSTIVFMNDGTGHFSQTFISPPGSDHGCFADVNNDGMVDILTVDTSGSNLTIWTNTLVNGHIYKANFGGDNLLGSSGNDSFYSGNGNDEFNGNGGSDVLIYNGSINQYSLKLTKSILTIADRIYGRDGVDTIQNIQYIQFSDKTIQSKWLIDAANVSESDFSTLTGLYIAYFNRSPDALGLDYWASRYHQGMSFYDIAQSFSSQPETIAAYPIGTSIQQIVTTAYSNVLNRDPLKTGDAVGYNYWVEELKLGHISQSNFLLALINGAFAQTGSSADKAYLAQKQSVGSHFAVTDGLTDITQAAAVMAQFNTTYATSGLAAAAAAANQLSDSYLLGATNHPQLVVQLTGTSLS